MSGRIYDLVVRRFLAVLYPPFEYEQTSSHGRTWAVKHLLPAERCAEAVLERRLRGAEDRMGRDDRRRMRRGRMEQAWNDAPRSFRMSRRATALPQLYGHDDGGEDEAAGAV